MKKIIKKITVYAATDGTQYYTEKACKEHEESIGAAKKWRKLYKSIFLGKLSYMKNLTLPNMSLWYATLEEIKEYHRLRTLDHWNMSIPHFLNKPNDGKQYYWLSYDTGYDEDKNRLFAFSDTFIDDIRKSADSIESAVKKIATPKRKRK